MFKSKVGYSVKADDFAAGVEAATMAKENSNIKLGMLFTNSSMNQKEVINGVKSVIGNKPFIGCTSSNGLIVPGGIIIGKSYAGFMTMNDDDLVVGVAGSALLGSPRETGKKVAREAINSAGIKKVPSYFMFLASPKDEEEYLKGIEDVIGTVPFFGGSAADDTYQGAWKLFFNDEIITEGCAVAFFYSKNECETVFTSPYIEGNTYGVVTNSENDTLKEIDGVISALKYSEMANINYEELLGKGLTLKTILNPLGVKDPDGRITKIYYPMMFNNDASIKVSNNITKNVAVIKMESTDEKLVGSVSENILKLNKQMKKDIDSYLLFYSGFTRYYLKEKANDIYKEIKKVVGNAEFLMVFSFGEYGSNEHSANICSNLSESFASFSK